MSRMWLNGLQWLVLVLQELEENGTIDYPLRSKTVVSGGKCGS
jgi:hypothetical protein